jgi:hypothetical protein
MYAHLKENSFFKLFLNRSSFGNSSTDHSTAIAAGDDYVFGSTFSNGSYSSTERGKSDSAAPFALGLMLDDDVQRTPYRQSSESSARNREAFLSVILYIFIFCIPLFLHPLSLEKKLGIKVCSFSMTPNRMN